MDNDVQKTINRQEFMKATGAFGFMLGFGFMVHHLNGKGPFVRPPGAVSQDQFLSLCLKCEKCLEICPTSVIQTTPLQDGLVNFRTPVLDFQKGYCNFCMKCVDVCPTGALNQETYIQSSNLGIAEIDPEACIAWSWKGCGLCVSKCPFEAIRFDHAKRPVVITEKCNGCGVCENICPRPMLRSYNINNSKGIVVKPITRE